MNLIKLEYAKLKPTKYFKTLGILWLIAFFSLPILYVIGINKMEDMEIFKKSLTLLSPKNWPLFDFVDIWQNLVYFYKMITVFLGLVLIINVTNEFDYKTARQNIINGLSRQQFWWSKITLILFASFIATFMLLILGLVVGYMKSPVTEFVFIIENIEFLGAYFLHLVHFLLFAFTVSLLVRRAGFAISLVVFWTYIFEPIVTSILKIKYEFIGNIFPMESGWNLIRFPFSKFLLQETQDFISFQDLSLACVWIGLFLFISYWLILKRDI